MPDAPAHTVDAAQLRRELQDMGVPRGGVVIVHSSLSTLGHVEGGARAVVDALLDVIGEDGTLVVPTFTPQVSESPSTGQPDAGRIRAAIPLFEDTTPTPMGSIPNAVLAHPQRLRSAHPQASVAAIGAHAGAITADHPLRYALGKHSPFEHMHDLGATILLLGVGHNRNSFLHYAESRTPHHRVKQRRFPYVIGREQVWVEVPDVGDDNGTWFPRIGSEADAAGLIRHGTLGAAPCQLMASGPLVAFARDRLHHWLGETAPTKTCDA